MRGHIVKCPGDAEVHDFHHAGVGDHHVCRFDIPVHNPRIMADLQRFTHGDECCCGLVWAERPSVCHDVFQIPAFDQLHHNIWGALVVVKRLPGVVDGNNGGVVKPAGILGFPAEPLTEIRIPSKFAAQHFHCDFAP